MAARSFFTSLRSSLTRLSRALLKARLLPHRYRYPLLVGEDSHESTNRLRHTKQGCSSRKEAMSLSRKSIGATACSTPLKLKRQEEAVAARRKASSILGSASERSTSKEVLHSSQSNLLSSSSSSKYLQTCELTMAFLTC